MDNWGQKHGNKQKKLFSVTFKKEYNIICRQKLRNSDYKKLGLICSLIFFWKKKKQQLLFNYF